ncbi:cardiolipin synthase [Naumannella halotolerans]|uniref:Cardiolipin synthase n=1 Tax=Naumannella halotolerans TaxID=993414 RepID=A0A4R7JD50_9ACTN|nr:cardiolipin synthase [Naumannella halotolerans]TDT34409.1 cardiolipin synthase [Naumannella halotolerans]
MSPEAVIALAFLVFEYILRFIAIGTVPENRRPSSGTAWLLLILIVPAAGFLLFALIGSPFVHGRRHRLQQAANKAIEDYVGDHPLVPEQLPTTSGFARLVQLNRELTSMPCVPGHIQGLHAGYDESIRAITEAIGKARTYVNLEIYILALDKTTEPMFDALAEAVRRGVKVRVLFDQIGSHKYPGRRAMKRRMDEAGIEFYEMMPIDLLRGRWRRPDLRNHRKLVVVDGVVGFMGSQNMIDSSYLMPKNRRAGRHWVDTNIEVTGEIVQSLDAVFATDWLTESGEEVFDVDADYSDALATRPDVTLEGPEVPMQLVPSGPGFPTEPNLRQFTSMLYMAQRHVAIVSPYFVPDESLLAAITTASYRGVVVELFASEQADQFMVHHAQRSYYQGLLEAGVRIHLYPKPAVLHTKLVTVDRHLGLIGSSNMDMRSFALDYEIMLLGLGDEFTDQLDDIVADYRARSKEITLEEWRQRPWHERYLDNALRITSALQ